ncbi:tail fiber domain-containing protein [Bradyrhizobium sp. CCGUVB1N3]|nr:tail fiber domain-containing protein [Bradyrhizobium sp. CCGUVB1N3]
MWIDNVDIALSGTRPSDPRLKREVQPLDGSGLGRVKELKPVSFRWKDVGIFKDDGKQHVGLMADNVQDVLPDAVVGSLRALTADGDIQPASIDAMPLVALLVKAVQELTAKVEALEAAR